MQKLDRAIDLLKTIKEIDLYLEFLTMSEEAEIEKVYTIKNHPDKKESINMQLTDGQVVLFYAWLSEERTKMRQLYDLMPEEVKNAAWEYMKGKIDG